MADCEPMTMKREEIEWSAVSAAEWMPGVAAWPVASGVSVESLVKDGWIEWEGSWRPETWIESCCSYPHSTPLLGSTRGLVVLPVVSAASD